MSAITRLNKRLDGTIERVQEINRGLLAISSGAGGSGGGGGGIRSAGGSQSTRPAPGTPAPPLLDNLLDPMKRLFYPRLDSIGAQLQKLVDATKQSKTQEDSTTRASR